MKEQQNNIGLLLISESSLPLAQTLQQELPGSFILTTTQASGCLHTDSYDAYLSEHFNQCEAWIFIGAMGICVRTIAPYLHDKHTDPAVVCVDSTGHFAISVLSGHIGGANELTRRVAAILGAEAVITTQSDRNGLWALDTLGKQYGWACQPGTGTTMNEVIARFVNGEPTALLFDIRNRGTDYLERSLPPHVKAYKKVEDIPADCRLLIAVGYRDYSHLVSPQTAVLYYIPQVLHIGIGLAHQASPTDEVTSHLYQELEKAHLLPQAIASIASIDLKREEPVLHRLAEHYHVHFYTAAELDTINVPSPSDTVRKHTGTGSVSEAAAILSSGGGPLILPKVKGSNYTLAIAVDASHALGGHIEIVGAGPGDPELISLHGRHMLEKADLILYAGSLVPRELTLCAKPGATVRSSASMNLEEQIALMKDFYDRGKLIVRLHTGDPCIYGAIQEQMNWFDHYGMRYHITPGISSFLAAAAELQSQFTIPERVQTIILTRGEGRTPMPEREQLHLLARSQSTMCIFLSAGIAEEVQQELLKEYPPHTPVAVCYKLTWKDQHIFRGELKDLAAIVKDNHLTLTTLIVVGEAIGNRQGLSRLYADEFKHLFRK